MKILFVCTANACRSQMAEAWAHKLLPPDWEITSAGLLTSPVSRRTVAVMQEVGLDLAGQYSKSIDTVDLDTFDLVVTLSHEASAYLPPLADPRRHWRRPFADPMEATGEPDEVREAFRVGRQRALEAVEAVLATFAGGAGADGVSGSNDESLK